MRVEKSETISQERNQKEGSPGVVPLIGVFMFFVLKSREKGLQLLPIRASIRVSSNTMY